MSFVRKTALQGCDWVDPAVEGLARQKSATFLRACVDANTLPFEGVVKQKYVSLPGCG